MIIALEEPELPKLIFYTGLEIFKESKTIDWRGNYFILKWKRDIPGPSCPLLLLNPVQSGAGYYYIRSFL